jgi:hypothetical protein
MNSAAIVFLAVTATKICIYPRYLKVSLTGSGMLFKVQTTAAIYFLLSAFVI